MSMQQRGYIWLNGRTQGKVSCSLLFGGLYQDTETTLSYSSAELMGMGM